jgi:O-antigen/teichoic acid export membrane protein
MISRIFGARRPSPVVRDALALMLSTGATSLLGVLFWGVAAHLFTVRAVGQASAEVSAMTLLANFAQLNLSSAFVRFLPAAGPRTRAVILLSYVGCSIIAVLGTTIFLLTSLNNGIVPEVLAMEIFFTASVVLWTIFVVQDAALIGLRSTLWVPFENISYSVAKLALLPLLVAAPLGEGLFFAWTIPMLAAVLAVNGILFWHIGPARTPPAAAAGSAPWLAGPRSVLSFLSAEWLTSLVGTSATYLIPLVIIKRLGPEAAGYFYMPWLVGASFSSLLWNILAPLIARSSYDEAALPDLLRRSIRLMLLVVVPVSLIVVLGAPFLLVLLSHRYAAQGTTLLRLIGASFPLSAVIWLFIASLWIRKRIWVLLGLRALMTGALLGLVFALIGPLGLDSVGVATLAVHACVALAVLPALVRWYRSAGAPPPGRGSAGDPSLDEPAQEAPS